MKWEDNVPTYEEVAEVAIECCFENFDLIMDYKKKYKEALSLAKSYYGEGCNEFLDTIFPELAKSEDEKIRESIIEVLQRSGDVTDILDDNGVKYTKALAWLEKQKKQKPVDDKAFEEWIDDWWKHNKVNNPDSYNKGDEIQFDEQGFKNFCRRIRNMYQQKLAELSKEDEKDIQEASNYLRDYANNYVQGGNSKLYVQSLADRIESLRPQLCEETYQSAKHTLAIKFMNYLDENRLEGKMCLSNGECEDINKAFKEDDWAKIMRYANKYLPHWKPSEEQMKALFNNAQLGNLGIRVSLSSLYSDLKKL